LEAQTKRRKGEEIVESFLYTEKTTPKKPKGEKKERIYPQKKKRLGLFPRRDGRPRGGGSKPKKITEPFREGRMSRGGQRDDAGRITGVKHQKPWIQGKKKKSVKT